MLHVRKHPDAFTLAIRTPAVGDPPPGYEVMTEAEFDAWRDAELAAGWTPAPPPEVNVIPQEVTPRQFRLALLQSGISPSAITQALQGDEAALIEWECALSINRSHPQVAAMAGMLGKTDAEVDAIFQLAATL